MNELHIHATKQSPEIKFDNKGNILSIPEDAPHFYKPLFEWLNEFTNQPPKSMTLELELEYFNTSSTKVIVDLLNELKNLMERDVKVHVIWKYHSYDEDMKEVAEQLIDITDVQMEVREIDS